MGGRMVARGIGVVVLMTAVLASAQQAPGPGPKYPPCHLKACDQDLGHDAGHAATKNGCTKFCVDGTLRISPSPIEACENDYISQFHIVLENGTLDAGGNDIAGHDGWMDWDDGTSASPIFATGAGFDQKLAHTYTVARTYYPSAYYAEKYKYTGDGTCSYGCRVQQSSVVIVYAKGSAECSTGKFKPTAASRQHRLEELNKYHARLRELSK